MKNVLIVGYGNIGQHIYDELKGHNLTIYDPIKGYNKLEENYDFAFICVPTEMLHDGKCDTSIVEETVGKINANILVIKSTIPVGTSEYLSNKYKKNIVFSPEYYGTTVHSPESPNFVVLSGEQEICDRVAELYYDIKPASFHISITDYKTAELAKYMENCFLALKVTFCSEFATIAKQFNISYPKLREIFLLDLRMGESHTFVDSKRPYYDSHCLNKDVPALLQFTEKAHLMQSVFDINKLKKLNIDY